jgi:2-polyprenyl-3-methyl-5-hydroxy-6-metoxy-1,4-benzoquinol methylase
LVRGIIPVLKKDYSAGIKGISNFNRILDNSARQEYDKAIKVLFDLVPSIMSRKIPEANVQQAFVLDTVQKFAYSLSKARILCIGCFEDSAAEGLEKLGYRIEGIDPVLNYDLKSFFNRFPKKRNYYDIIFSTSVIEHVENDELFITQIASLLAPGGVAILTADFNDQYKSGDCIPQEDFRLYTQKDFKERLLPLLKNCSLVDKPQWACPNPDFVYAGCNYTFATLVFRKDKT